uniref:Uncharacterized LOC115178189 n=1 Tax=Salmo trutta TaxID=8032 RepID=A0A674C2Q8_SALTR
MLDVPALLLTTLEELTEKQLKTFQSHLTTVQLPGFPPIPESQLENVDRQDTVDQMVERYGPEGAVRNTLRTLRWMKRVDLAEKLERDHTRGNITIMYINLYITTTVQSRSKPEEAGWGSYRRTEKKREALLLATLGELSTDELKIFQQELTPSKQLPPYLTAFPPIPETQLENADRQVTVDQMVERYGPEGAVEITLTTLRRKNQNDLAKLEREVKHSVPCLHVDCHHLSFTQLEPQLADKLRTVLDSVALEMM